MPPAPRAAWPRYPPSGGMAAALQRYDARRNTTRTETYAMRIGVPTEIKDNEYRVGMTPSGVRDLASDGHTVFIQQGAGDGSGFLDDEYVLAGAKILPDADAVYNDSD